MQTNIRLDAKLFHERITADVVVVAAMKRSDVQPQDRRCFCSTTVLPGNIQWPLLSIWLLCWQKGTTQITEDECFWLLLCNQGQ
jgi:hypothetical protein